VVNVICFKCGLISCDFVLYVSCLEKSLKECVFWFILNIYIYRKL